MTVNRVLLQASVEEYPRVLDDSIEVVLRHDSVIDSFFFLLEARLDYSRLAETLLALKPDDEVLVFGSLKEGSSPSASITLQALTLKAAGPTGSAFEEFAAHFDEFPDCLGDHPGRFDELGLGHDDGDYSDIPF